jgi:hypothetical protein
LRFRALRKKPSKKLPAKKTPSRWALERFQYADDLESGKIIAKLVAVSVKQRKRAVLEILE